MPKTILITGATDGIGRELARLYAPRRHRLILVGRRDRSQLVDTLFTPETYCQADLSQPNCVEKITSFLAEREIEQIDLLIHNAGMGYMGDVAEQSAESLDQLLAVNVGTPIRLTHALAPHLTPAAGKVVFISSVVTAISTPDFATYGASKAALDGFARSLRIEWQDKVAVQVIHPGATKTGIHAKVGMDRSTWEKFPSAVGVARQIVEAIAGNRPSVTIGGSNRALQVAGRQLASIVDGAQRKRQPRPHAASSGQPHCVITGAANGIGRALAQRYAAAGYRVTGVDVDEFASAEVAAAIQANGGSAQFIKANLLTDTDWIAQLDPVDVFIHNAGISAAGYFSSMAIKSQMLVYDLNLVSPLQLTLQLLRETKLTDQASIVIVSSLSKYVGYPGAAVYAATKDGVAHFGRTLSVALWPTFHALTVFPGPTRTDHAARYSPDNSNAESRMSPETLAQQIFLAQQRRQRVLIPGAGLKAFALAGHLLPQLTESAMKKAILDKFAQ